jgi:hypothetical protein
MTRVIRLGDHIVLIKTMLAGREALVEDMTREGTLIVSIKNNGPRRIEIDPDDCRHAALFTREQRIDLQTAAFMKYNNQGA